jgi:adenine specific DNA methylase Mod
METTTHELKNQERTFYKALSDIFLGPEVNGDSGYVNLRQVKSEYFKNILPPLREYVEGQLKEFPEYREELYRKLFDFFTRCFSESGSLRPVSSRRVTFERNDEKKDVLLCWETQMFYYVRSDKIFNSKRIELNGHRFFLDVSKLKHKKAWEKKRLSYELKELAKDGTIVFLASYSENGTKPKTDVILAKLRSKGVALNEDLLQRVFRIFEQQSELDYFLCKNARRFLREQFDLWLYHDRCSVTSVLTEPDMRQIKILQDIGYRIIDFISELEEELVGIWNKPKFALASNYVVTLDRIAAKRDGISVIQTILRHENFSFMVKEWKELGMADKDFKPADILTSSTSGVSLNSNCRFLPVDTKYFKNLEIEIISLFDSVDRELDGWLIKSENYQALNTILPKFKERVKTVYIDPPFNKEQDADYFYNVKFKDSTWITMLENRLVLAKQFLSDTGCIFARCDYTGNAYLRLLMDEIFAENFRNEIVVNRTLAKQIVGTQFAWRTESLLLYSKSERFRPNIMERPRAEPRWYGLLHMPRGDEKPRMIFGRKYYPPKNRRWGLSQDSIDNFIDKAKVRINENKEYVDCFGKRVKGIPELYYDTEFVGNEWLHVQGYSQTWGFPTENSEELLRLVIESTSSRGDFVMDFFLGIGTATAVAHKLGRKWIGIEMGEHFHSFRDKKGRLSGVLVRMKEVLAGKGSHEPTKTSKDLDWQGGGFFKYYELEQFEETLKRIKYEVTQPSPRLDRYRRNQRIFMGGRKMLYGTHKKYYKNTGKLDLSQLYPEIDITETISNLFGKEIKTIRQESIELQDGLKIDPDDLDYELVKPLIIWNS